MRDKDPSEDERLGERADPLRRMQRGFRKVQGREVLLGAYSLAERTSGVVSLRRDESGRGGNGGLASFLRGLKAFLYNEMLRTVYRAGTVTYCVRISCPGCSTQGALAATRIIAHYPVPLARALGLPARLYAIHIYADKIAQDASCRKGFDPQYRPTAEEERDFLNGLVQVDFHERLHVFLQEEGSCPRSEEDRVIESLESKLSPLMFPEYRMMDPRPWHSHCCTQCSERRRNGDRSKETSHLVAWGPSDRGSEVS